MSRLVNLVQSKVTWVCLGTTLLGYFAFLLVLSVLVVSPPPVRDAVLLHLDGDGLLFVPERAEPLPSTEEINAYLCRAFQDAERMVNAARPEDVQTLVIITAEAKTPYDSVYGLMRESKRAGFSRWDLREKGTERERQQPPARGHQADSTDPAFDPANPSYLTPRQLRWTILIRSAPPGAKGRFGALVILQPEGETSVPDFVQLERFLKARRQDELELEEIHLMPDSQITYDTVLQVVKMCRRVGFTSICYDPPPDSNR